MVRRYTAVCLVALTVFCSFCDGHWSHFFRLGPRAYPRPRAVAVQSKPQPPSVDQQSTQIGPPITWQYPADPQAESIPVGPSTSTNPVYVSSVAVKCNETNAHVEVQEDLFGTGVLINPADLTLGTCAPTAEDSVAKVLIFDVDLQACGSTLSMANNSIIYTFILNYNPEAVSNLPVVRTSTVTVIVQCHYPRIQNVSSHPVNPYWSPFSAIRAAQELLYFNMTLMTNDWQYLRPSYQFSMGGLIKIQVSVMQYFHVPLRVYVDSCIATLSPDTSSSPSYVFIDHGCMLDGLLTGSASQFMPRTVDNKLQFQLEAFRFLGATSGTLYITCHLIATTTSYAIDSNHRACSYNNGWKEASGFDSACASCYSGGSIGNSSPGPGTGSSGAGPGVATSPGAGPGVASYPAASPGVATSPGAGPGVASYPAASPGVATSPGGGPGVASYPAAGPGVASYPAAGPGVASYPGVGPGIAIYPSVDVGASGSLNTGTGPTGSLGTGFTVGTYPGGGFGASGSLNTGSGPTGSLGVGVSDPLSTGTGPNGSPGVGASDPLSTGTGPTGSLGTAFTGYASPWSLGSGVVPGDPSSPGVGSSDPLNTGTGPTGSPGVGASDPLSTGTGPTDSLGTGFPVGSLPGYNNPWTVPGFTGGSGVVPGDASSPGVAGHFENGFPIYNSPGAGGTGSVVPARAGPFGYTVGASGPLNTGPGPTGSFGPGGPGRPVSPPGSSGSGYGVTGSFGTFGTVSNFPPFYNARKVRDVSHNEIFEWEAQICLGPIQIAEVPV